MCKKVGQNITSQAANKIGQIKPARDTEKDREDIWRKHAR